MADFKVRFLSPVDARRLWPGELCPRIEHALRRAPCDVLPEDFFAELMSGAFSSITLELHGKIVGVIVVEEITMRLAQTTGLFVWAAESDAEVQALAFIEEFLDALAEKHGYDFIQFSSSRQQWRAMHRRNRFTGWKEKAVVWEKTYGQRRPEAEKERS